MKKMMPMIMMMLIMLVSLYFTIQGLAMHAAVSGEEAELHQLQDQYFSLDKATRDSAPANSQLNKQLVQIQQYPSQLMELKLIGVGKILTGIYALLFGILIALIMMPIRLGKMLKGR